ncbi:MAG TPA: hypothetical protein PKH72_09355, partial [Rhodoferax sp.]|nr:hypothetical protein [Rhodoferax sp.]
MRRLPLARLAGHSYFHKAFAWLKAIYFDAVLRFPPVSPIAWSPPMTEAFVFDAIRTPRGKGKKDGSL